MPRVGALNIFNSEGWLINSSEMWPVADANIRDRRYFREFTSGRPTPDVIVEHVVSRVTKVWTTIFVRKIVDRSGNIIGFAIRAAKAEEASLVAKAREEYRAIKAGQAAATEQPRTPDYVRTGAPVPVEDEF